jgi:glutaredoxin
MLTIYSKPACPFCDHAKALATSVGLQYREVILDVEQPKLAGQTYITKAELLELIPTARTMPQIMNGTDEYIGGYTELKKWVAGKDALAA